MLVLLISGVCSTCPKNLIRRAENLLGALFRDGVGVRADSFVEPRLDVTTRVVCSFQTQRSTPLLAEAPRALTEEFSEAPDKQALWKADGGVILCC